MGCSEKTEALRIYDAGFMIRDKIQGIFILANIYHEDFEGHEEVRSLLFMLFMVKKKILVIK